MSFTIDSNQVSYSNTTSNTSNGIRIDAGRVVRNNATTSGACNESSKHTNDEKALFHGLKSAYRMSREYDGTEYGTEIPQHETAARIAGNVAVAYIVASGAAYDREESFEYLRENVVNDPWTIDRLLSLFGIREASKVDMGTAGNEDLAAGIDRAWTQVDDKWHHDDAAKTALASAEAYLGEKLYG